MQRLRVAVPQLRPAPVHAAARQRCPIRDATAAAGPLDGPQQRDVLEYLVTDRGVAARALVYRPPHRQQLAVGRRQRRAARALGDAQRQERQPGPLQQRLDQPLGGGAGLLPGVRANQVETRALQQVHGGGDSVRCEYYVGIDEDQHLAGRIGGLGELLAGVRLAEPAGGQRRAGEQPHLRSGPAHHIRGAVGGPVIEREGLDPVGAALPQ